MPGNEANGCLGKVHKMLGGCLSPKELEQQPRELPSTVLKSNAELHPMTPEQHLQDCPPVKVPVLKNAPTTSSVNGHKQHQDAPGTPTSSIQNRPAQVQALISKFEVGHQKHSKVQSGHSELHPTSRSQKGQFDGREPKQQERLDTAAEQYSHGPQSQLGQSKPQQLSREQAVGNPGTAGVAPTSRSLQVDPVTPAQCADSSTHSKSSSNRHQAHRTHPATGKDDDTQGEVAAGASNTGSDSSGDNTQPVDSPGAGVESDSASPAEVARFHYGTLAGRLTWPHSGRLSATNTHIAAPLPPSSEAAASFQTPGTVTIQVSLQSDIAGDMQGLADGRNGRANGHEAARRPRRSRVLALVAVGVATAAVLIHGHPVASFAALRDFLGAMVAAAAGYIRRGVRGAGNGGVRAAASSGPAGGGRLVAHKVSVPLKGSRRRGPAAVKLLHDSGMCNGRINRGMRHTVRALWPDMMWLREAQQECHSKWCDVVRPPAARYLTTEMAEEFEPQLYEVGQRIIEECIRSTWD